MVKKNIRYIQNILKKKKPSMILLNLKIMIGLIITLLITLLGICVTISFQLDKLNKVLDDLGKQINDDIH